MFGLFHIDTPMNRALIFGLLSLNGFAFAAAPVDYVREVKPLLTESCTKCHGASQQKSGLRLDTAALALKGGDSGPSLKPGKAATSLLVQVIEGTHDDIARMPYKKPPLDAAKIALIRNWIDQGAAAPADEKPDTAKHWSFIPPERAEPPKVKQTGRLRNAIDGFILARLEQEKIQPSPEADRVTLIRRLSLDLIGLPPAPAEVDSFVKDASPDAYDKLVERLLASPHYGERWGRWWLDAARYADSNGYSIDAPRQIWKYRDWVIDALNRDLPFDQFTLWQLAGDLLPGATTEQKIATGFHRNTQINQEGGIDPEQFRIESAMDRVSTTGTVFLGLTIGCAQCHDHKFDPIKQREYYQLFAFFNSTEADGHGKGTHGPVLELPTPQELAAREAHHAKIQKLEQELKNLADSLPAKQADWESGLGAEAKEKLKAEVREALALTTEQRSDKQKKVVADAFREQDAAHKKLQGEIVRLKKSEPPVTTTLVMRELPEPRESFIFIKGDFTRHGDPVKPGTPEVLHPLAKSDRPNRLDLARWIVDPANPLTARVTVNRLWQQYFGRGIVETENDFGTQGAPPTNPQLLDWLATELVGQKWSLKAIHRLIVTSATYRQSSRVRPELNTVDANNRLLARQSRLRLDAEIVRDAALAASGLLSTRMGGPGVFPPQPDGVMNLGQSRREWKASAGDDRHRRGIYTYFWRATPYPALTVFDAPDAFSACTRRLRSNTPLQALTLLNDEACYEFAQALSRRILRESPATDEARLEYAFRLCVARPPSADERQRLRELFSQPPARAGGSAEARQEDAWLTVARVLLNLDETITRE